MLQADAAGGGGGGGLMPQFPEENKRSDLPPLQEQDVPGLPSKSVVKRSADASQGYMAAIGYDPTMAWAKRDYDPGYESYMHSIGYDPTMAWGKRGAKRDGYDSYMQSINYDPTMAWGKRDDYGPYLQDYDPLAAFAKKTVKRSSESPSVGYYPKRQDAYMDMYLPNHFLHSYKRSISPYLLSLASNDWKRAPNDMGAQGFHEGIFTHNFGEFSPVKRGKREANAPAEDAQGAVPDGEPGAADKRRLGMGASGFHGDTFSQGFGDFSTMKKRRLGMGASGFHGDTFSQGFGDFSTMKKRRLGMGASGFHGDTFSQGFGDFSTMKKRRMGMGASGFHGDTFSQGFGDFSTMKKRRMGMGASGFHGDTFSQGFGDFSTMKKRRLGMGASGFHGDTFSQGFGDFSTMKKRRMGMGASGFHGDTFSQGFGDFSTMKRSADLSEAPGESGGFPETRERSEKQETLLEEKEGTRRKREALGGEEEEEEEEEYFHPEGAFGSFSGPSEMTMLQQEGRPKRSLVEGSLQQVEVRPPIETDLSVRRRRYVEAYDLGDDTFVAMEEEEGAGGGGGGQPFYKRSVGGFDTMKRRR